MLYSYSRLFIILKDRNTVIITTFHFAGSKYSKLFHFALMEKVNTVEDNKLKCYNCSKVFKTQQAIDRHKQRKSPCLIREVAPDQAQNPNRCIFCNKIFSNIGNKNKHLSLCKIKNGGMEILADKVKYEQEIRILKEQREIDRKEMNEIREQMQQLKDGMKMLTQCQPTQPVQIVNGNVNNINITQNIVINNYLTPSTKHLVKQPTEDCELLKLYRDKLVQTPVALIPLVWFNPDAPENLSVFLVNKSTGSVLTYDGSDWKSNTKDIVIRQLRDRVYEMVEKFVEVVTKNKLATSLPDSSIVYNISRNKLDVGVTDIELEMIGHQLLDGRHLVEPMTKKK